jgi:hypothetical protein
MKLRRAFCHRAAALLPVGQYPMARFRHPAYRPPMTEESAGVPYHRQSGGPARARPRPLAPGESRRRIRDAARTGPASPPSSGEHAGNPSVQHTQMLKNQMLELVGRLHDDAGRVTEPKAKAMCDTAAAVLTGLIRAFDDYRNKTAADGID